MDFLAAGAALAPAAAGLAAESAAAGLALTLLSALAAGLAASCAKAAEVNTSAEHSTDRHTACNVFCMLRSLMGTPMVGVMILFIRQNDAWLILGTIKLL